MTEPTRDALHAETIAELEHRVAFVGECGYHGDVKLYEYAAACVRRVPELEAEVERLREYAGHLEWCATCAEDGSESCIEGRDLRAAATREGTDA